jgi:hypothetical protein
MRTSITMPKWPAYLMAAGAAACAYPALTIPVPTDAEYASAARTASNIGPSLVPAAAVDTRRADNLN